jgi:putative protease
MINRDSNKGNCAQPCRWKYNLVEEKRPGEYMPVYENDRGTFIFNSKDLCLIRHLPEILNAGVTSLKIEGRAKSQYYVAVTANAYRGALDSLKENYENWTLPSWVSEELNKISHRNYSTGFYFGTPQNAQTYQNAGYVRDYAVAATVDGYEDGYIVATLKNKFLRGAELDCLSPKEAPFKVKVLELFDQDLNPIESAPHPMMKIKIPFEHPVKAGSMLRMKCD